MKRAAFVLCFCFLWMLGQAQDAAYSLEIQLRWKKLPIQLEKNYYSEKLGDSLQFKRIRFYLSQFQTIDSNKASEPLMEAQLVDLSVPKSLCINWKSKADFDSICFLFGLPDEIQSQGASGGDLDPQFGMYWTWKSGYILCKLEGSSPSLASRKNQFVFHLGGYEPPYSVSEELRFAWSENASAQYLEIDLHRLFESVDLKSKSSIMSAGVDAFLFSKEFIAAFHIGEQ